MEAYKNSLLNLGLSGPTNCAPMMRMVSKLAITAAQSRTAQVILHQFLYNFLVVIIFVYFSGLAN